MLVTLKNWQFLFFYIFLSLTSFLFSDDVFTTCHSHDITAIVNHYNPQPTFFLVRQVSHKSP